MSFKFDLFPIAYSGNKYNETKKFFKAYDLDLSEYDIICEPFGGIFGFSRASLFLNKLNKECKIYINDIDTDVIKIFKMFKDGSYKDTFEKIEVLTRDITDDDKNKFNDFIKKKVYINSPELFDDIEKVLIDFMGRGLRRGLLSYDSIIRKIKNYKKFSKEYDDQLWDRIVLSNMNYNEFLENLPKDKKKFIYFDPPYFDSNNTHYSRFLNDNNVKNIGYIDNSTIYLDILNFFNKIKFDPMISSMFVMNKLDFFDHFFGEFKIYEETGVYQNGQKNKKYHITYLCE
jgi:site-specific DNA-adenine methylase